MILLLLFVIFLCLANSLPYEHCEQFPIHFDLYNCTYSEIQRRSTMFYSSCQNWGTWECSEFKCFGAHPDGYCRYGEIDHNDCCTLPEIHYLDMWFKPMSNGSLPDWSIEFYNFKITGYGNDIVIDPDTYATPGVNYTFTDVFHGLNNVTFLSIIFNYNESCATDLTFFIDGAYAFNISGESMDIYIDFSFFTVIKGMIEFIDEGHDDEEFYFTSAHILIPTQARIMEFFLMGPNRTKDQEICVYMTLPELDECQETIQVLMQQIYSLADNLTTCDNATTTLYGYLMLCRSGVITWMVIAIVLGSLLLILLIIFLIWLLYRLFSRTTTDPLKESQEMGEDVFF